MSPEAKRKSIAAIKGTHDILPCQARKWQRVEEFAQNLFELYGYREIRTPVFEATELFQKGTGETSDIVMKEMYTFVDKGGRSLTLRPEYTPSIARAILEHRLHLQPDPLRFYFIGPMFRYDKPQKGRYRQFHQMDVEVFNEKDPAVDAEIVEMAARLLEGVKVKGAEVLVNSVGCRACRPDYHMSLRQEAGKERDSLCADCQRKIDTNPLRIFDCKVEACRELAQDLPKITDYLCEECQEHFAQFLSCLDLYELPYTVEPLLVRGLDYYTKTTFEFVSTRLGAQDADERAGSADDRARHRSRTDGRDDAAVGTGSQDSHADRRGRRVGGRGRRGGHAERGFGGRDPGAAPDGPADGNDHWRQPAHRRGHCAPGGHRPRAG